MDLYKTKVWSRIGCFVFLLVCTVLGYGALHNEKSCIRQEVIEIRECDSQGNCGIVFEDGSLGVARDPQVANKSTYCRKKFLF